MLLTAGEPIKLGHGERVEIPGEKMKLVGDLVIFSSSVLTEKNNTDIIPFTVKNRKS